VAGSIIPITSADKILTELSTGKTWSLMDLCYLANGIIRGTPIEEIAEFLCRDVDEARAKIAELKTPSDGYA
jgi:hypothetical protein